jgi:hypothetical protein
MPGEKIPVILDKPALGKIWDKKMGPAACEALRLGAEKGLNGSKTEAVKAIGKDDKGYRLSLNIESLDLDAKAMKLSASVKSIIATMPDDKYFGGGSNSSNLPGVEQKRMEKDVKELMLAIGVAIGEKTAKSLV